MATNKEESDVKLDLNNNEDEEESEEQSEESANEEEDEEIIDLDMEADPEPVVEEKKEEPNLEENLNLPANTEPNEQHTQPMETKNNKTGKKTFFTPKNQTLLGKIFVNTTIANTEEGGNYNRTEAAGTTKTAISMLSEKFAQSFLNRQLGGGKINIYEFLLHDEHIQKFIAKNSGEHEKFKNFIGRNKEFHIRKSLKLQEKVEKFQEEEEIVCHGNPNNKVLTQKDIRNPSDFLGDNLKYVNKRDTKVTELRTKIVEDTNKHLTHVPKISETTKKLADKKIGEENKVVHTRLFKEKTKHDKPHKFNPDNVKRKPYYKKREIQGLDLTNLKKDIKEIQQNVEKLYQDAKERKKNKEKPALTLKDIYDIDNIASESSKYVFLDSFVKDFERSVCDLFFVRDNYMLSLDDYISLLHKLGFIKFDLKKQKELLHKKSLQEEEKRNQDSKEAKDSSVNQNNSNIQHSVIKTEKNSSMIRGKSEKPEDRQFKKADKEIKVINESWKYFTKNEEKVNTNQVLVFLAGILGLYEGEKPEEQGSSTNNIKVESKEGEESKADQTDKAEEKKTEEKKQKEDEKNVVVEPKGNKSEEPNDKGKKSKKKKKFYNSLPFNCGSLHPSYKKGQKEAKSEEKQKKKKKDEILLKQVVPELDLSVYGFSAKMMNHLKFAFRYFYDHRMNFLLKEKRKLYNKKTTSEESELVFKPKLGNKSIKCAEEYRKKIKEQIKADYNHQENPDQGGGAKSNTLKLEEIYNILRQRKENEIAKMKLQQNEQLIKQCTFQPNSHKRSKSPKVNPSEVSKKLFVDADQRTTKKKNLEEEKQKKEQQPVDFPFAPTVNPVKTEIFQNNPINFDEDVKKKVERYERARIEKKLCEYQKKKGVNNFKNVSNIEEMIKKEENVPMKFGIESKTYKDTFEVRKLQETKNGNFKQSTVINKSTNGNRKATFVNNETNNNEHNDSGTFEAENNNHNNDENTIENNTQNYNSNDNNPNSNNQVQLESEPNSSNVNTINPNLLLAIDVNITEDTSAKLEILKNDDLDEVIEGFCARYGLDDEKKGVLKSLIEQKLNETHHE